MRTIHKYEELPFRVGTIRSKRAFREQYGQLIHVLAARHKALRERILELNQQDASDERRRFLIGKMKGFEEARELLSRWRDSLEAEWEAPGHTGGDSNKK